MNESQAIRLCLRGRDPRGFEFLVVQYRREAFYHARALTGNHDDALEMCQESFARAYAAMPGLAQLDQFYPWFYRILRNGCLNLLKRREVARRHEADGTSAQHQEREDGDPARAIEAAEEQAAISTCLGQLSMDHREILAMKYFQHLKYREIEEILGIPRGTVMSRLYSARKAFQREYLAQEGDHER